MGQGGKAGGEEEVRLNFAKYVDMMHPQLQELRTAIGSFLQNPDGALEVHCPDHRISLTLSHLPVLARPRRSMGTPFRKVPRVVAPAPADPKRLVRAENIGFVRTSREAYNPKTRAPILIPLLEARFVEADEGADWCFAALQDVHGIGDSWLWITNLDFSEWPIPLPQPQTWPPGSEPTLPGS